MARSNLLRVIGEIRAHPWAIKAETLEYIEECVANALAGRNDAEHLEAVATRIGRPLDNAGNGVEVRGPVAILDINGPIYRYAPVFSSISAATSIEMLTQDFQKALDSRAIEQILLRIDSPGGQIDGVEQLAHIIREGSTKKPVTAYVDGDAGSAAYWLAAAAPRIVASLTSRLGSVGVVASVTDNRAAQERQGVKRYEIVSSRAPNKRPDVATEAGRSQIQELVDSLEAVMLDQIAAFRSTTVDTVAANFGQGKMLIASDAVAAGMADEILSEEPLVTRLAAANAPRVLIANSQKETTTMQDPTPAAAPAATAAPAASTATPATPAVTATPAPGAERQRIAAILALPEAQGREGLARMLALETDNPVDIARNILAAAPVATAAPPPARNPLAAAMEQVPNPKVGAGNPEEDDSPQAQAAKILAFVPAANRRKVAS